MQIEIRHLTPLLQVFDMPTSVGFYRDLLGFNIIEQSNPGDQFDWARLKLGGASLMLNTAYEANERPPHPDAARLASHGDTTLYFYSPSVDEMYGYLLAKGVAVERPVVQPYGMKQLYVNDPDGYALCFQHQVEA